MTPKTVPLGNVTITGTTTQFGTQALHYGPTQKGVTVQPTNHHAHLPANITWHTLAQANAPTQIMDWLMASGSLTQRLQQRGVFSVLPQQEFHGAPTATETKLLMLPTPTRALIREVLLALDDIPVVVARTVLPLASLTGANAVLGQMANRSLGSALFEAPAATREHLWVTQLPDTNPLGPLWGRQNYYLNRGAPLLVADFFLPAFWQQFAN